jgi:hypothetical protein
VILKILLPTPSTLLYKPPAKFSNNMQNGKPRGCFVGALLS